MLTDMIKKNRSYRRFFQEEIIEYKTLESLVNLARFSASAGNKQPLKYILSCDFDKNALIFDTLAWAAYLKDWEGPPEGERPTAYIIVLGDKNISGSFDIDAGIACQSILLGATELGLGGCILGAVNRAKLRESLTIPDQYQILLVISLGKPKETVVIETASKDIRYWRDSEGVHHVPKRPLDEVILEI